MDEQKIIPQVIEEEMKTSYLDYAMSVIVGRALPDVRDGLKPVHRRVLYTMWENGLLHNKPFRKSANVVGMCMAKYHPHGDSSIYDTLVRMAQDFSLRYPLIQGQGNFGSVDGDSAAAMRYTEARLSKISEHLLMDIDKKTVDFRDNFDGSLKEPTVLPAKLPNLLINGSTGIAVGMATNIPPHNLREITDATIKIIDNPEITTEELIRIVPGPDFPTGGIVSVNNSLVSAYKYGRGKVSVKAVIEEEGDNTLIISEIPYMVNKSHLIEQIADLVKSKRVEEIKNIRDESDRDGIRVVIELKSGSNRGVVLNKLYAYTRLKVSFGIIMLSIVNGAPKVLGLKSMLEEFIKHRKDVVRKRTQFDFNRAKARQHVLEGLIVALNNVDDVVKKIKASETVDAAKNILMRDYDLSEVQAKSILEMRLQKIASLEQKKIRTEQQELAVLIERLSGILASKQKIFNIIKDELTMIRDVFGDERRSKIVHDEVEESFDIKDLIDDEPVVVTVTHAGYIKRLPIATYKTQGRGGRGVVATGTRDEDFVEDVFIASTHSYLLCFTNKGRVDWLKVYNIPEGSRQSRGKPIVNLLNLRDGEKVTAIISLKEFSEGSFLVMSTKKGVVKKTESLAYSKPRKGGIIAVSLDKGDELVNVVSTDGKNDLILGTKNGMATRFKEVDVRSVGRSARGVRGITLSGDDEVVRLVVAKNDQDLLTITENGFGKRTPINDYRLISRGGKGVLDIKTNERNGKVVSVRVVKENDQIMLISRKGICIRMPAKNVSRIGRNTQGVRIMKLDAGDRVVAAAKIVEEVLGD